LIAAIGRQAVEQSEQALPACRLEEGTATAALRRLCAAWLDVAERYRFIPLGHEVDAETREHRHRILGEPLRALIERGKASGEFSGALSTDWCVRSFGALVLAGARAVADGALTHDRAPDTVFRSLYEGLKR